MARQLARLAAVGGLLAVLALLVWPARAAPRLDDNAATEVSATTSPSDTPAPSDSPESFTPTGTETPTAAEPAALDLPSPTLSPDPLTSTPSVGPTSDEGSSSESTSETPESTPPAAAETAPADLEATSEPTLASTPTEAPTAGIEFALLSFEAPSFEPGAVLINEVAWAGTDASPNDEWIELWNPGADPIDLDGWSLTDGGDLEASLTGQIPAFGFHLLERTDDTAISDLPADQIYTGALSNTGESLALLDPSGNTIDTANSGGGAWPAGATEPRTSMERHGRLDLPGSWSTFTGSGVGLDAAGDPIRGTPGQPNSPLLAPASPTPTPTSPPAAPTAFPVGAVLINEVAWAGTGASTSDEWIELFHPGSELIDLDGWRLTDDGDLDVDLAGSIAPGAYYLLERSDDGTISDLPADRIYTGALANDGEALRLLDPTGAEVDLANPAGGAWPAGDTATRASMERGGGWRTFSGYFGRGLDADGHPVRGTPGGPNSVLFPAPTATWVPGRVVINEVLIRPRYDWEGAGGVTTGDEFIELYNRGPGDVYLRGWILDDVVEGGSAPYTLPGVTLGPGAFVAFFRSRTAIALNDDGDSVRLSTPDGKLVDKVSYLRVRAANLSYGRVPDGDEDLAYGLWPTPGEPNETFRPRSFPPGTLVINEVAWAGGRTSADEEWIELWNPGAADVNLFGWTLTDDGDIRIYLSGVIEAGGHFLLRRGAQPGESDPRADLTYRGALANDGERLRLLDPRGSEVDVVNPSAGPWPGGDVESRASMERLGWEWKTFPAGGETGPLGTPRAVNSWLEAQAGACGPGDGPCP